VRWRLRVELTLSRKPLTSERHLRPELEQPAGTIACGRAHAAPSVPYAPFILSTLFELNRLSKSNIPRSRTDLKVMRLAIRMSNWLVRPG